MSFSLTQLLAEVTAPLVRVAVSGCLFRKALYQPIPGVLSMNWFGRLWRNSLTLAITSALRRGNPFLQLSMIHFLRVISSSSVKIVLGSGRLLTKFCFKWNWIAARGTLCFFAAAFFGSPLLISLIAASKSWDVYLYFFDDISDTLCRGEKFSIMSQYCQQLSHFFVSKLQFIGTPAKNCNQVSEVSRKYT